MDISQCCNLLLTEYFCPWHSSTYMTRYYILCDKVFLYYLWQELVNYKFLLNFFSRSRDSISRFACNFCFSICCHFHYCIWLQLLILLRDCEESMRLILYPMTVARHLAEGDSWWSRFDAFLTHLSPLFFIRLGLGAVNGVENDEI